MDNSNIFKKTLYYECNFELFELFVNKIQENNMIRKINFLLKKYSDTSYCVYN